MFGVFGVLEATWHGWLWGSKRCYQAAFGTTDICFISVLLCSNQLKAVWKWDLYGNMALQWVLYLGEYIKEILAQDHRAKEPWAYDVNQYNSTLNMPECKERKFHNFTCPMTTHP